MIDLTPEQRGAVDALKALRGRCPSAETLVEYEALSAQDRQSHSAHDHISVCSRCQLVLLHVTEPAAAQPSNVRWMLPIAAVLVLAVGITLVWRAGALAPANPAVETVRGTEIQPVTPIGSIETVTEFTWQSPIRAERYRVKVTRGTEQVWMGETNAVRIDAPIGVLVANVEYRWMVEAIDREGEVRMTSPPQSFVPSRSR